MKMAPICPRCGGPLTEPSPWASGWHCALHGEVYPLRSPYSPSGDGLRGLLRNARVPIWVPWPLPAGWLVTGFAGAGDDRTGTRACVVALSGPNPVGGPGEMLLISEEPGVGLGAHLAGLPGPDPGPGFAAGPPHALVGFGLHEFPLWHVEAPNGRSRSSPGSRKSRRGRASMRRTPAVSGHSTTHTQLPSTSPANAARSGASTCHSGNSCRPKPTRACGGPAAKPGPGSGPGSPAR